MKTKLVSFLTLVFNFVNDWWLFTYQEICAFIINKLTQVAESVGERVTGGPAVTGALVGLTALESGDE